MNFDPVSCGRRIKELRRMNGITQEQLSEHLHISTDHLGKTELGKRRCSMDLLIEIADFFDVSMDYLLLGRGNPNRIIKEQLVGIIEQLTNLERLL